MFYAVNNGVSIVQGYDLDIRNRKNAIRVFTGIIGFQFVDEFFPICRHILAMPAPFRIDFYE